MKRFKDVEGIRAAGVDELAEAPAMNRNAAEKVYEFFHTKNNNLKGE